MTDSRYLQERKGVIKVDLNGKKVTLHDMSLRDGMHAKSRKISIEEMVAVACGLDEAGMPLIEVTHGDGLGGASVNCGFPAHSDEEYLERSCAKNEAGTHFGTPCAGYWNIGSHSHGQRRSANYSVRTHCTEADISQQHIGMGRDLGMDTVGFLMMAHMVNEQDFLQQALLMESWRQLYLLH